MHIFSQRFPIVILAGVLATFPDPVYGKGETDLSDSRMIEHVRYLASDTLEGRATGYAGAEKAADYIVRAFKEAGLGTLPGAADYRQIYETTVAVTLGPGNRLSIPGTGGDERSLTVEEDYVPFAFSASATVTGPVLFAGYGITAPELGYDDYDGVDASGKIVLVLRHEPRENEEDSVFEGRRHTRHAEFRVKAKNAADHGALAILLVDDPLNHEPKEESLVPFGSGVGSEGGVSIPAVQIRRESAEFLWGAGRPGRVKSMESVQRDIDADMKPNSFVTAESPVTLTTDVVPDTRNTANVVGWLPATTPASRPAATDSRPAAGADYIVIGAHYDHLGFGGSSSLAPDVREIHNGADDNASGTAGLIEIARALASDSSPRRRGVVFVAFSGEEIGLRGSAWFTDHPPLPLEGAAAMLNMDMIGRLRDERLTIGGVGTSPLFRPLLDRLAGETALQIEYSESGYGPSDHNSFYAKDIPVLFFFTGAHEDYHRPSDDSNLINAEGMAAVAGLALDVARELIFEGASVPFAKAAEDTTQRSYGAGSGSGAWLGIIPGYGSETEGVEITGVRDDGPAKAAGISGGDVIVAFAGKDVANIYDLQDGLDRSRPGDEVEVIVMRGGERRVITVTLARKNQR